MNPTLCCIGHITLDKVVTPTSTVFMPGGTAYYFAHALAGLHDNSFRLVASLAETELGAVRELRARGVDVDVIPSRKSVFFENIYGDNPNNRKQRVRAKADPFTPESLHDTEAAIFHLGTLLADDFPTEVLKYLAEKGEVSVDAQGFLRRVEGEEVIPCDWDDKLSLLPLIHTLKANEHEMELLTGSFDPREAASILADWGVKEVVLTLGDQGSLILENGIYHEIPAFPVETLVDATGCGDTYMAGYLHKRVQGASPEEAGHFAAAMCTLKLECSGPFKGDEADVKKLLAGNS